MPSVTVDVYDRFGADRVSLTGINWAWFDADPAEGNSSVDHGTGESTDGSGQLVITLTNSLLSAGQNGTLILWHSANGYIGYYRLQVAA